jgi:hypothetical protein
VLFTGWHKSQLAVCPKYAATSRRVQTGAAWSALGTSWLVASSPLFFVMYWAKRLVAARDSTQEFDEPGLELRHCENEDDANGVGIIEGRNGLKSHISSNPNHPDRGCDI